MKPGQAIEIQLVDGQGRRVRLANVLLTVAFFEKCRRHYVFDLRPTGRDGRASTSFAELNTRRLEAGLTSLMDFNVPLTALEAAVQISVPSEADLRQRLAAIEEWDHWSRPAWVFKWPVNGVLAPVEPRRVELEGAVTRLEIPVSLPTDDSGRP